MIKACLFDCFGVLYINARAAYFSQFPDLYDQLHDLNRQADLGLIDRSEFITAVASLTGVSKADTLKAFAAEHVINQPLVDFIRDRLKSNYKIGLLTNLGRGWIQDFFTAHQLHDLFDEVVISSEEGIIKPNPSIFERAATRLGVLPSDCLMIDDHAVNCEAAQAVGMHSLRYDAHHPPQIILNTIKKIG